jgi:hypothetical protein
MSSVLEVVLFSGLVLLMYFLFTYPNFPSYLIKYQSLVSYAIPTSVPFLSGLKEHSLAVFLGSNLIAKLALPVVIKPFYFTVCISSAIVTLLISDAIAVEL